MRGRRAAWAVVAIAAVACGGSDGSSTPFDDDATLAALSVIDTRAEHRPVTATAFVEADDGQPLEAGDGVRTDATGFAEIAYADGSLTRLGAETSFTVVALDGDTTIPRIETELEVGETWHRVNTVTGERGSYEVRTAVGTAAVRGTAFAIACTIEPVCTFSVTEGLVVVTTLDGQQIEIAAGETVAIGLDEDQDAPPAAGGGGDPGGGETAGTATGGDGSGGTAGSAVATSGDGGAGLPRAVLLDLEAGGDVSEVLGVWVSRNAPLDVATGRFERAAQESCAVTVNGRNVDHANTPATAIEAPIDETLRVDAVATGELDRYTVDLVFAGVRVRAAEGEVLADDAGDRTTFRGDIDVSDYAQWGVGLYEVEAATTGTRCDATAFVNVTGRNPLTTGTGIAALLLAVGGAAGLVSAINLATGQRTATLDASSTLTAITTSAPAPTTTQQNQTDLDFVQQRAEASGSTSLLGRISSIFRGGGGS